MRTDSLLERAAAGRVAASETIAAAGFMPPLHAHAGDEAVQVVAGSLTLFAGAEVVRLEAGESFLVAAGVAHTFRAESAETRVVHSSAVASAGRYEDFLRATGPVTMGPSGSAAWAGLDDAQAVTAVAAAANVSVYGPPGMLPAGSELAARAA